MKIENMSFVKYAEILMRLEKIDPVQGKFLYINPAKKEAIGLAGTIKVKFNFNYEGEAIDDFVVQIADFLHVCQFYNELEITSDYNIIAGDKDSIKLNVYQNNIYVYRTLADNNTNTDYQIFQLDKQIEKYCKKAFMYVNSESTTLAYRTLQIQNNYLISSSMGRVYSIDLKKVFKQDFQDVILHHMVMNFLFNLDWDQVKIKQFNNMRMEILSEDLSIYIEGFNKINFMPLFEEPFQAVLEKEQYFELPVEELRTVIAFLEYYVKDMPNALVTIKVDKGEAIFIVDGLYSLKKLTTLITNTMEESELIFKTNLLYLKDVLNKFYDKDADNIKIYTNSHSPMILIKDRPEFEEENIIIKYDQ